VQKTTLPAPKKVAAPVEEEEAAGGKEKQETKTRKKKKEYSVCTAPNCTTNAQSGVTGLCFKHGGGGESRARTVCGHPACTSHAQRLGLCIKHQPSAAAAAASAAKGSKAAAAAAAATAPPLTTTTNPTAAEPTELVSNNNKCTELVHSRLVELFWPAAANRSKESNNIAREVVIPNWVYLSDKELTALMCK
jgi:hypothetical protein